MGSKTEQRHRQEIRQVYGYQTFHASPKLFALLRYLYARAWLTGERQLVLFDQATTWLVAHKILLPGATVLERLVTRIEDRANQRVWRTLTRLLNAEQRRTLEDLLTVLPDQRLSLLEQLRRGPTRASSRTMVEALRRVQTLRDLGVSHLDLAVVPAGRLRALVRYGLTAWAQTLADLQPERKLATLLAVAQELEASAQDEVVDLLVLLVEEKFDQAVREGQQERLRLLMEHDTATRCLRAACLMLLDDGLEDTQVRQVVFESIPRVQLQAATELLGPTQVTVAPHHYDKLVNSYRSLRRFLPLLLNTITFAGTQSSSHLLQAWAFLRRLDHDAPLPDLQEAPRQVVQSKAWRSVVFDDSQQIDRRYYTFCVLHQLHDALRRRDVFVSPSLRWGDPRAKLLQGQAWRQVRPQVCTALGKSTQAWIEMQKLAEQLDQTYRQVARNLRKYKRIAIIRENGRDKLNVKRLEKLDDPASLVRLRKQVQDMVPWVDLPGLLMEIDRLTGFTAAFTHISEGQSWAEDLPLSVCAVLLSAACNIGLEPLIRADVPALRRSRLLWVQQNYLRAETLSRANARLVAAQADIPLVQAWGGGEVASADGQRFVVPARTLHAAYNRKYFGPRPGVTLFTFISDQFTAFYGVVIPGAVREALYILDGLLEQQTVLQPKEIMTDTASYTDVVFGLFWLVGYQFSPRLADIGQMRFWRIDSSIGLG